MRTGAGGRRSAESTLRPCTAASADVRSRASCGSVIQQFSADPVLKGEYPAELVALLKTYDQLPVIGGRQNQLVPMAKSIYWGLTIISRAA